MSDAAALAKAIVEQGRYMTVTPPAHLRLYRATATERFYGEHDRRIPVR